jgi:hypothetical protein
MSTDPFDDLDGVDSSKSVSPEEIDHTPLKFGKHKGKTPSQVALLEEGERSQWLVWAYENVGNFDVCSATLYRDLGGRRSRAVAQPGRPNSRTDVPAQTYTDDRYTSRASAPAKPRTGFEDFDDFDDDIPF